MATQPPLKFGSLFLSTPDNGVDGYDMTKHDKVKVNYIEDNVPNSDGSIKKINGVGQSDQRFKLEFECLNYFSDAMDLISFLDDIQDVTTDTRNHLRTVYYGILNDGAIFTETNCDMEFEISELPYKVADGSLRLGFRVRFSKWGK